MLHEESKGPPRARTAGRGGSRWADPAYRAERLGRQGKGGGAGGAGKGRRRGVAAPRAGDWRCNVCNASVFASKTACFQCGTARPGDAGACGGAAGVRGGDGAAAPAKRQRQGIMAFMAPVAAAITTTAASATVVSATKPEPQTVQEQKMVQQLLAGLVSRGFVVG